MAVTPDLSLRVATYADLGELSTLFARSFHPVSPYMRRLFPDTTLMRSWWKQVFAHAIADPEVTLMVVTSTSREDAIVALGRWRFFPEYPHDPVKVDGPEAEILKPDGDLSAGSWTLLKTCEETDQFIESYDAMISFLALGLQTYMKDRPKGFYHIELVGTVHEAKGLGAGRLIIDEVKKMAKEKGVDVFVETNNIVLKFYEKLGFELEDKLMMPDKFDYEENVLVWEVNGAV